MVVSQRERGDDLVSLARNCRVVHRDYADLELPATRPGGRVETISAASGLSAGAVRPPLAGMAGRRHRAGAAYRVEARAALAGGHGDFVELVIWWHARRKGDSPIFAYTKIGTVPGQRLAATTAGVSAGLVLFVLLLPAALVGWRADLRHLTTWSLNTFPKVLDGQSEERSGNDHVIRNQSLQNAAYRLGNLAHHLLAAGPDDRLAEDMPSPPFFMDRPAARACHVGRAAGDFGRPVVGGGPLGASGRWPEPDGRLQFGLRGDAGGFSGGAAHYFMLAAPAAMFFPWWLACRRWSRAAVVMAATPAVLVNLHYAVMPLAGRIGLLGLGLAAWLVAAVLLVWRVGDTVGQANRGTPAVSGATELPGRPCAPRPFRNCS